MATLVARQPIAAIANLPSLYNPKDLALIRRTVAIDTNDDEFSLFIHWARSLRLDPLRRQVHAFVFNKNDPKKRRLTLVTSIEGMRAIAARTGMPYFMLAKCAEAQAIRKGWPEDLSNTFVGEEVDHAALQKHPAEAAAEGATIERLQRINAANTLTIDWLDNAPLDAVPIGQLADRIVAFLRTKPRQPDDLTL